jgi:hypothetical protein
MSVCTIHGGAARPLQIAVPSRPVTARKRSVPPLGLGPEDLARFEGEGGLEAPETAATHQKLEADEGKNL